MPRRAALLFVALAACGGDPARPDAMQPDAAPPPELGCLGAAFPTTAADPIVIPGHAYVASPLGQDDLAGARVEAYDTSGGGALFITTSDDAGLWTLTVDNADMTPLDGYLRGTADGYLDTYVYPHVPLAADSQEVPLLFVTDSTLGQIAFSSGINQSPSLGFLGVLVQDCVALPIPEATVTVSPTSTAPDFPTQVVYVTPNNFPDPAAEATRANGLAYVFNVPVGAVTVDAEIDGTSLLEHDVTIRASSGVITTTAVAPGP